MESISWSSSHILLNPISLKLGFQLTPSNSILSFPYYCYTTSLVRKQPSSALKATTDSHQRYSGAGLLKKPKVELKEDDSDEEDWVDWEEKIREDTVPLVGFVKMILHSEKYENGERLSLEHENIIVQRLLAHHPEFDKKIGCGINYIMVGQHPDFESSRCLFVVRKNGAMVDFSYWKCIKGFIKKKYPLYADSFISQHFRQKS